jgi:hypothetical protein
MYAKIDGDVVAKYPYTMDDLKKDNPFVGFPTNSISNPDISSEYGVVEVVPSSPPEANEGFKVEEAAQPLKSGDSWVQNWDQVPKTAEDIAEDERRASEDQSIYPDWGKDWHVNRRQAYGREIEQIEFITENGLEAWQAKVAEIKALYPKT